MPAEERYERGFPLKGALAFIVAIAALAAGIYFSGVLTPPKAAPPKTDAAAPADPTPSPTPSASPSPKAKPGAKASPAKK